MNQFLFNTSMIVNILAMIWAVLDFMGYIRLWNMRYVSELDDYISKYSSLKPARTLTAQPPSASSDKSSATTEKYVQAVATDADIHKVTLAFTYSPGIELFIKSILDQTVKVDNILCVTKHSMIPSVSKHGSDAYIRDVATVTPAPDFSTKNDLAGATIQALIKERDCDALVIGLCAKNVYGRDYIQALYKLHLEHPNTLLYSRDFIIVKPTFMGCVLEADCERTSDSRKSAPEVYSCNNMYSLDRLVSKAPKTMYIDPTSDMIDTDPNFSL